MKSILIVDDNAQVRATLRKLLESKHNLKVCGEATDGIDAIEKNLSLKPDLVVLDLSMPRMNGLEAARILKSTSHVRIILFTNYANEINAKESEAAGVDAVCSKGGNIAELFEPIERLLELESLA
jgi:two-component system chemotaxis response regulator CheB